MRRTVVVAVGRVQGPELLDSVEAVAMVVCVFSLRALLMLAVGHLGEGD